MKTKPAILDSFHDKLKGSKFRWLNEKLYTSDGKEALSYFKANPEYFKQYHEGYLHQINSWPINPLNLIIKDISEVILKRPKLLSPLRIADLGCGEGRLGTTVSELGAEVFSFDLVSVAPHITVAEISALPLPASSIDIALFSLSLMGTNWPEFIYEALRILKINGILYIAEVVSRFQVSVSHFVAVLKKHGLFLTYKNEKSSHFIYFKFIKQEDVDERSIPNTIFKPCNYKRR